MVHVFVVGVAAAFVIGCVTGMWLVLVFAAVFGGGDGPRDPE